MSGSKATQKLLDFRRRMAKVDGKLSKRIKTIRYLGDPERDYELRFLEELRGLHWDCLRSWNTLLTLAAKEKQS